MSEQPAPTGDEIALPAMLDLTGAEPLHRMLLERARQGGPMLLRADAVERLGTAAAQVLLAAAADARARGVAFRLRNPSPVLTGVLTDLGIGSALGCEEQSCPGV